MKTSTKGGVAGAVVAVIMLAAAIVQPWEGRELKAYQDIVGVWTICDGETRGVQPGDVATPAECDRKLYASLAEYKSALDRCLVYPLPPKTAAALLSWTYNVGAGAACGSTLVRLANTGNLKAACEQLMRWNRAGGREVRGLTNRRAAERKLCLEGLG
jgi:GH24 family phage-related lysozyme (muramidase)